MSHTRTVVRIGDYFVLSDRLKSEKEHTYDLYLHCEGKLSLDGRKQKSSTRGPARPLDYEALSPSSCLRTFRPLV